jgi:diadenosine tetraphosphate (Ap4A) HIT family hydrolase
MNSDCIFCKIGAKQLPSTIVYEDPEIFAFEDIEPQAPTHVLICPRKHVTSLAETGDQDGVMLGKLLQVAAQVARQRSLDQGYRTVINTGRDAGQSFPHLHVHLLGGRSLKWPPG